MDTRNTTILVVDDEPNNLRVLSTILNKRGYKVQKAICGNLALKAALASPPDLILLDIIMPKINGYEVCKQLKSIDNTREIPVIFLSALDQTTDKVKAFELGGVDYITKPFQVEEVLARIENQLTIKNLQNKLQKQNDRLQREIEARKQAEEKKDELISIVSHELRTPLACIRTALELLSTGHYGVLEAKGHQFIDIALTNSDRLLRLLNDLLDLERIEAGIDLTCRENCNIADLMEQAADSLQAMAEQSEVTLSVSTMPVKRYVNPDHIIQVLTNLLSNAIKFSNPGSTVWLTAELPETGDVEAGSNPQLQNLLIKVKDRGRGIPSDKLESIFGRFEQVYPSDSHQKGGSGLGLAICRSIIEQYGGRIWVESSLGGGSTFYFTLPDLPANYPEFSPASERAIDLAAR
ncbi:MAG TPA: hybrid sensor histidine kinase/response regulator [Cyanobacteria bacterium UBA11372]|nr:hybrid sensor histidine kinase/response regulator [Cyanobacteria bacterium UBA11372]